MRRSLDAPTPDADLRSEQAIEILLDVADSMTSADGERAALNKLASLALRATGADRCAILVCDPTGDARLLPAAGASRIDRDHPTLWQRFRAMEPIDIGTGPGHADLRNLSGVVTLPDALSSSTIPDRWKRVWGSKSVAYAPLRAGGETYGLLAVDYVTHRHAFSEHEVHLLDAIASAAGVALRTARLVDRLQRSVEAERKLAECTAALQSGRSLPEVLDLVVDRFARLLRASSCSIYLLNGDRSTFRVAAHRGLPPPQPSISMEQLAPDEISRIRRAWSEGPHKALLVPDTSSLPRWQELLPSEIGPGMLIPLLDGRDFLGFAAIGRPTEPFDEDDTRVSMAFAGQAAVAVAKARLHDALQARLRVTEALHRLTDEVMRTSDLKAILPALNRSVGGDFGVECLRLVFMEGSLAKLVGARRATGDDLELVRGWRNGSIALEPHAREGDLGVPISVGGRTAGVLWVRFERQIDPIALELVAAIASGLGEVATKARLRRIADRRSQELAVASERERIARDLHDTVGQTFYGIGLKLQDLLADVTDPSLAHRLTELRTLAGQAVADVRSAVYALSFLHVRARGLGSSLRALTRQFSDATGVNAELRVESSLPRLGEQIESALYRVVHEALVNVDRHARATGVVVTLGERDGRIELSIGDDGVGLEQRQALDWRSAAHFGMRAMQRAVEEVKGVFRVSAARPRGLLIQASIPLPDGGRKNR